MRILINTASTFKGGSVQVARSFIEECRDIDANEYHVILSKSLERLIDQRDYPRNFHFYTPGFRPATRVLSRHSSTRVFKQIEACVDPDVVFTTSGPSYWKPQAPHLVGFNLPHYVYADSPFFSRISYRQLARWRMKGVVLKYFFKKDSDAFVVQTDDVNRRLRKWLKTERVYTVSNTWSLHYDQPRHNAPKLPAKTNGEFRFLTLSSWYTHKNLGIIPEVLGALPDRVRKNVRFILTLPEQTFARHFPAKFNGNIINIGPVKPEEGPGLYLECDALFLPTLLECFSASYAEAMKMEVPILTSDLGFAHTVCGDAALYTDPLDPGEIATGIIQLMDRPYLRQELVEKGHRRSRNFMSSTERAKEYLKLCERLVDENKKSAA